jgi:hypothetical protein
MTWEPPEGMDVATAASWRAFYRAALLKYDVTPQQYRDMYIAQHGCCYICRKALGVNPDDPKGRGTRRLGIDHNHVTGAVRGLLCTGSTSANTCNRLIARYSLAALKRAVEYMETEPGQTAIRVGQEYDGAAHLVTWPDREAIMSQVLGLS